MSLVLSSILIGAGGALLGRFIAKRRAEASQQRAGEAKDAEANAGGGKTRAGGTSKEELDADEAAAAAEVEAEVPTAKDSSPGSDPALTVEGAKAKEAPPTPRAGGARDRKRKASAPKPVDTSTRLDGFLCQLGDVLTRMTGEEAWLAGGLVLSEEIPVAVLFVAPDAGQDCAIYVRPAPRASLFWLEPLDPSAVLVGGEPPSSVEHGGVRFDRARRLPLRPRRIGAGAPDVGDGVLLAEYASAGAERLLVLKSNSGAVRAYRGLELEEGSYEVIAAGDATL